jgi:hypothetical protein
LLKKEVNNLWVLQASTVETHPAKKAIENIAAASKLPGMNEKMFHL